MRGGRRQAGYTAVEFVIAAGIASLFFATFGDVFGGSDDLVRKTRTKLRAHEDLRRNLEAVANVLRDADIDTLDGFDAQGESTNPLFSRVVGVDNVGRLYGGAEELRWVSAPSPVDGVPTAGRVVHVRDGVSSLIADRVPSGGLTVSLQSGSLIIHLKSYYVVDGHVELVEGNTAVALRN